MQTREDFEAMAHRRLADWTEAQRHPLRASTARYPTQGEFRSQRIGLLNDFNRSVQRSEADSARAALVGACRAGLQAMVSANTMFTNFPFDLDGTAARLAADILGQQR